MESDIYFQDNTKVNSRLLRLHEVANYLNISRSHAYHLVQAGLIPCVRMGKSCRVRPQDLEDFIEQNIHSQTNNPKLTLPVSD